jgi:hypothetical protein
MIPSSLRIRWRAFPLLQLAPQPPQTKHESGETEGSADQQEGRRASPPPIEEVSDPDRDEDGEDRFQGSLVGSAL